MPESEIAEKLERIFSKLDIMEDKVTVIDVAIRGNDEMGTDGMKQHIQGLQSEFDLHTQTDSKQFASINTNQTAFKYYVVGATAVLSAIVVVANIVVKFIH